MSLEGGLSPAMNDSENVEAAPSQEVSPTFPSAPEVVAADGPREGTYPASASPALDEAPYDYPPEARAVTQQGSDGATAVVGVPLLLRDHEAVVGTIANMGDDSDDDDDEPTSPPQRGDTAVFVTLGHDIDGRPIVGLVPIIAVDLIEKCVPVYHLSLSLRHSALAELLATALFSFAVIYFLVLLPFVAIVYIAAKRFLRGGALVGMLFVPTVVALRAYACYVVFVSWSDPIRIIIFVLLILLVFGDCYLGLGIWRFAQQLQDIPEALVIELRLGWDPTRGDAPLMMPGTLPPSRPSAAST